jgi:hypothetical protein
MERSNMLPESIKYTFHLRRRFVNQKDFSHLKKWYSLEDKLSHCFFAMNALIFNFTDIKASLLVQFVLIYIPHWWKEVSKYSRKRKVTNRMSKKQFHANSSRMFNCFLLRNYIIFITLYKELHSTFLNKVNNDFIGVY